MSGYFLRRFLLIIPTFLGITLAVFVVMHFVPGGPVERQIMRYKMAVATQGGVEPTEACDAFSVGKEVRVPYTADYYFYKRKA